jgi:hypothetical protein
MTYKEYDNIFLETSGTSCPAPPIGLMMRNMKRYNYQYEVGESRDFISMSTGVVELLSDQPINLFYDIPSAIGMGDYIYYSEEEDTNWTVSLIEYQISTGIKKSIVVFDNNIILESIYTFKMSYIEPHKLFICLYLVDDQSLTYIVDFTAMTCTPEREFVELWWTTNIYVTEISGKTWLFVFGNGDDTFIEYHKNYTDNSVWGTTSYAPADIGQADISEECVIVGNEYVCFPMTFDQNRYSPWTPNCRLQWVAFDMVTLSWRVSNLVYAPGWGEPSRWLACSAPYATADMTSNILYGHLCGLDDWYGGVYPYSFIMWYEYNPGTNVLTTIRNDGYVNRSASLGSGMYSTDAYAYLGDFAADTLHSVPGLTVVSNVVIDYDGFTILDGDGVIYKNPPESGTTFQAIAFDGTVLQEWILPNEFLFLWVIAAGNGIVAMGYYADNDNIAIYFLK